MQDHVKIGVVSDDEPGLRERKKQERRRRIEAAALDLFERHGFDSVTVDAIAAAAEIAPRTFFHYFPTKEDVVLADYARRLERITEELGQRPSTEAPWAAVRASFLVVAADYETERADLVRRFAVMAANPSVYARSLQLQAGWEDALAGVLSERMHRDPDGAIEPQLLAAAALAAMRSSLRHWILSGHRESLPGLVARSFDRLAAGLAEIGVGPTR